MTEVGGGVIKFQISVTSFMNDPFQVLGNSKTGNYVRTIPLENNLLFSPSIKGFEIILLLDYLNGKDINTERLSRSSLFCSALVCPGPSG